MAILGELKTEVTGSVCGDKNIQKENKAALHEYNPFDPNNIFWFDEKELCHECRHPYKECECLPF
ncbi:hypothetical protein [Escherichia coli]|uniref:hypothetical protein n=1 Tax=Escherichia coli TaxID=562 RepID=UPI0002A1B7DF|nr:hypothetical protein [Escherichia coli]ELC54762.1 hypothetical protein WGI_05094 [Escherichia coli KTE44]